MRVKICGITNLEDGLNASNLGADALGFVFYEKSPRYISPLHALEIVKKLPPFIVRVGLFVNVIAKEVDEICKISKMDLAQIHFEADDNFYKNLKTKHIKVIRAKSKDDLMLHEHEYKIVDAFVDEFGGAGKRCNLEWFEDVDCSKIILAGGLDFENLNEVKKYNFYGVDVSSGVELTKGKKCEDKMRLFIENAKN